MGLGSRGYSIVKSEWSPQELASIKKELTIVPITMNMSSSSKETRYAVFRESKTKLYMPRFYGTCKFGAPTSVTLLDGQPCAEDCTFVGALRDYQIPVVDQFLAHLREGGGGGLLQLPCGWGKTSAALYIFSQLKRKTLFIVHMEFLMNQLTERIHQFLPGVQIGRIQRDVVDVEGKDIVLCMLQSLVRKDYPPALFANFGFTIIDEVHHMASQTFSSALFKVVTKNMLGLSATMDRKDGTTKVFKWFLGDIVAKVESRCEQPVEVRAITFVDDDATFNECILDYRGNAQNSSMISKLCNYPPRTEFILAQLCAFLKNTAPRPATAPQAPPECAMCRRNLYYLVKNTCCNRIKYCFACACGTETKRKCPDCKKTWRAEQHYIDSRQNKPLEERHVIVMAHNLNVLQYIYEKMVSLNLADVGFYIGGMHRSELKKSEQKQVILATYSMTQEGLDIPSLNTEFLITPKTDITQCVGRILRAKHPDFPPIIYDFVDTHALFQRQWARRKAFYRKHNYRIKTAKKDVPLSWETVPYSIRSSAIVVDDAESGDGDDDDDNDNDGRLFQGFGKAAAYHQLPDDDL